MICEARLATKTTVLTPTVGEEPNKTHPELTNVCVLHIYSSMTTLVSHQLVNTSFEEKIHLTAGTIFPTYFSIYLSGRKCKHHQIFIVLYDWSLHFRHSSSKSFATETKGNVKQKKTSFLQLRERLVYRSYLHFKKLLQRKYNRYICNIPGTLDSTCLP